MVWPGTIPRSAADFPAESLLTAATTRPVEADGQAWVYVAWSATAPALEGRRFRLYGKPGDPAAVAAFTRIDDLAPLGPDLAAVSTLLKRGAQLGDSPVDLAATLDALLNSDAIRAANAPDAKLAAALQQASAQPAVGAVLELLATRFHTVRFVLGRAWAGRRAPGLMTFELRELDPLTQAEVRVVARLTLNVGTPTPLPAPIGARWITPTSSADDLRVALAWGESDELRRRAPLVAGFDVWRLPAAQARELGWDSRVPTTTEVQKRGERIHDLPILPTRHLTTAEVAALDDPEQALVVDRGPAVPRWNDGEEFAWFVAARDALGNDGLVVPGAFGFVCTTRPPAPPRDLTGANGFSGDGATEARRPTITLAWSTAGIDLTGVLRFEVFRGATNLPAVVSTNAPDPIGKVGEAAFDPTLTRHRWTDLTLDARANTNLWGQGFWYAVRTVRTTACGPRVSPLSPPIFLNVRRYDAPDAPTGELGIHCPRVVLGRPAEPLRGEGLGFADRATRHYRLEVRRRDRGVSWAEFTISTGIDGASPLLSPQLRFAEDDDLVAYEFELPRVAGQNLALIGQVVAGGFSGAISEPLSFDLPGDPATDLRVVSLVEAATVSLADANPADPLTASVLTGPFALTARRATNTLVLANSPSSTGDLVVQAARPGTAANGTWRFVTVTHAVTLSPAVAPVLLFDDPRVPADSNLSDQAIYRAWIVTPPRHGSDAGCAHVARPAGSDQVVPLKVRLLLTPRTKAWRIFRRIDEAPPTLIAEGVGEFRPQDPTSIVEASDDSLPEAAARICYFGRVADENGNWSPLGPLGCEDVLPAELPVPLLAAPEEEGDSAKPVMRLQWFCPPTGVRRFEIHLKPIAGPLPPQGGSVATAALKATVITTARPAQWFSKAALTSGTLGLTVPGVLRTGPVGTEPTGSALGEGPDFRFAVDIEANQVYEVQVAAVDARGNVGHASHLQRFTWKVPRPRVDREVPWPQRPLPPVQALHPGLAAVLLATNVVIWPGSSNTYPVGVRIGSLTIGQRELIEDLFGLGDGENGGRLLRLFATRELIAVGRDLHAVLLSDTVSTPARPAFIAQRLVLYRQQVPSAEFPEVSGAMVQVSPKFNRLAARVLPDGSGFEFLDPMIGLTLHVPPALGVAGPPARPRLDFHLLDLHPVVQGARYRYWVVHFDAFGEPDQTIPAGEVEVPL